MEIKNIQVVAYDKSWPQQFANEAVKIKLALSENLISIHHIGSTAVPGLSAKPKIDIIAEVRNGTQSIPQLESIGYSYEGEWNIPFKFGFSKRGPININLHVYEENHPEIELNVKFRDYLIHNEQARIEYNNLKHKLLTDEKSFLKPTGGFTGYNLGKDLFIRNIISKLNLQSLRLLRATHYREWDEYHRIRREELFIPIGVEYNPNHPSILADNSHHFVLCKANEIVAVAMIEFLSAETAALRSLATDRNHQNKGYGTHLLQQIEKWIKARNFKTIKTHANLNAEKFYRKLNYHETEFDDTSISSNTIKLGKNL